MTRRHRKQRFVFAIGLALSAIFLGIAFRNVDAESLWRAFRSVALAPLVVCVATLWFGIVLRGIRWRLIMGRPASEQRNFSHATVLGVLSNLILPGRAGDFVRVFTLARLRSTSVVGPLASALIDRLTDLLVLVACGAILFTIYPVGALLKEWLAITAVVVAVFVLALLRFSNSVSSAFSAFWVRALKGWLRRWPLPVEAFIAELKRELGGLTAGWMRIELLLIVLLVLCADYGAIASLMWAFHLDIATTAPLLLWTFLAAGSALPSAPGYVGVYQLAAVWALSYFGVVPEIAVALATLLQVLTLLVAVAATGPGAINLLRTSKV